MSFSARLETGCALVITVVFTGVEEGEEMLSRWRRVGREREEMAVVGAGGLEQRLLELGSFLDVELGKGALLPQLDGLLLLQHQEGVELLRNLFAIAASCNVAKAHLAARFER